MIKNIIKTTRIIKIILVFSTWLRFGSLRYLRLKYGIRNILFLGISFVIFISFPGLLQAEKQVKIVKIKALRLFSTEYSTRVIFNLSQLASVHTFILENPNRLVFDFDHATLTFNVNKLRLIPPPVKNIRSGYPVSGRLRIVLDMNVPFTFKKLPLIHSPQMVFDIYTKKSEKSAELATFSDVQKVKFLSSFTSRQKSPSEVRSTSDVRNMSSPASVLTTTSTLTSKSNIKIKPFIVVIDAGHGGKDTGAIGVYKTKEKDVVLSIATQLTDLINQQPHMRAVMTRKGDYFVTLADRLVLTRKGEADLFIAIHADSYFNNRASGASVFALSSHGATTVAARWLSDIDNHSELGGVELNQLNDKSYLLRSVLIDLAQTETVHDSVRLGNSILDALEKITRLHSSRVEQAPFMVLKSPDIPSVLVETGFLSNGTEELRLRDKSYQHKIVLALFKGICFYKEKYVS